MSDLPDLRCECYCAFDANTGERLEHCGVCRAADEIQRLRDQNSSLLATNYDLRKERDRMTDELAEARGLLRKAYDSVVVDYQHYKLPEAEILRRRIDAFLTTPDQPDDSNG